MSAAASTIGLASRTFPGACRGISFTAIMAAPSRMITTLPPELSGASELAAVTPFVYNQFFRNRLPAIRISSLHIQNFIVPNGFNGCQGRRCPHAQSYVHRRRAIFFLRLGERTGTHLRKHISWLFVRECQ